MIQRTRKKFTGPVDISWGNLATPGYWTTILVQFSTQPTTSEDFTLKYVDPGDDREYDCVFHYLDPSSSEQLVVTSDNKAYFDYSPPTAMLLAKGASVRIEYPNSDGNTIAITLIGSDQTV